MSRTYPKAHTIVIEDAANGPAIIDALRHTLSGIIAVPPQGGKLARAQAAQPKVEAGNVYLPNPRPYGRRLPERAWVDDFLYQLTIFPYLFEVRGRTSWRSPAGRSKDFAHDLVERQ